VLPRECDNDACDYETGVIDGRAAAWWVHADTCDGPVAFKPPCPESVQRGSFADFLLNGAR
jgi:hypothetical protein